MLSNKILLNLILLAIFVALALFITSTEQTDTKLPLLSSTDAGSVNTIAIRHNSSTLIIERASKYTDDHTAAGWHIRRPVDIAANGMRVSTLLRLLVAPVHSSYPLAEIDAKSIGLDDSTDSISFDGQTFTFGEVNPATGLRYISDGETVYTIEDVYSPLIRSHFSTLVSFRLLPEDIRIDRLILLEQTIDRDDSGRWQSNIDITADQVATIIASWRSAQAFGVRQYIQRESQGELFVTAEDGAQFSFVITDTDPWLILARPELDLEYHLEKDMLKKLTGQY
jgi:hypothetical protein